MNPLEGVDYDALQADVEAGNWRAAGPPVEGAGARIRLKSGRPSGRRTPEGNTPTTSVRLPVDIKARLDTQAAVEQVKPAEVIRRALVEYLDRHSA